jgi:hypothetical protein
VQTTESVEGEAFHTQNPTGQTLQVRGNRGSVRIAGQVSPVSQTLPVVAKWVPASLARGHSGMESVLGACLQCRLCRRL